MREFSIFRGFVTFRSVSPWFVMLFRFVVAPPVTLVHAIPPFFFVGRGVGVGFVIG